MSKLITLKMKNAGPNLGPFEIKDGLGNVVATDVTREELKHGITLAFVDSVKVVTICSIGKVEACKSFGIDSFTKIEYGNTKFNNSGISCVWVHLKNPLIYNTYYGQIEPYIIEYPIAYQYQDEILQNVKDHTQVYKYVDTGDDVLADHAKYELDNAWFNKAIIYNNQQCSGILNLIPKPKNNLSAYMTYPKLNSDSKDIIYTKSDNMYQYNTFWNVTIDPYTRQFINDCESLSIDKVINQSNMDYSKKSHKKATLRAKELKIRHIMDNRDDIHLVSQFIIAPSQISYK